MRPRHSLAVQIAAPQRESHARTAARNRKHPVSAPLDMTTRPWYCSIWRYRTSGDGSDDAGPPESRLDDTSHDVGVRAAWLGGVNLISRSEERRVGEE